LPNVLQLETDKPIQNNSITLHWENINVHTPDTSKGIKSRLFCKKVESNAKHIIRGGEFYKFDSFRVKFLDQISR